MADLVTTIQRDPENKQLIIEVRDQTTGAVQADYHRVIISLDDLEILAAGDLTSDVVVQFRKFSFKDANDSCVEKFIYVLSSQVFTA